MVGWVAGGAGLPVFPPAPPKQGWSEEGEGGTVLFCAPGSFLCLPAPAWD